MNNRKPIYNRSGYKRIISSHNGMWTPQRRVSHTPGCKRGYRYQTEGAAGFYVKDKDAPHFDPWQTIHVACDKQIALGTIIGPMRAPAQ